MESIYGNALTGLKEKLFFVDNNSLQGAIVIWVNTPI